MPVKGIAVLALLALAAGCASRPKPAPVVDARALKPASAKALPGAALSPKQAGDLYTVRSGDTLYSIALHHGLEPRQLAQWNGLDDPTRLRVGQTLRVKPAMASAPAATASAPTAAEAERSAVQVGSARIVGRVESRPLDSLPPLPPRAPAKPELARMETPKVEPQKSVELQKSAASSASALFMWPVKGKVLAEFSEPRRKGIDIDGRPGDPIVAAASGHVTYIGSGIPGMGKLVVIRHDNGFITVYAHNRDILVKEKQAVARGQQIAVLGSTDADRPKLHFQIRKGAAAVDPLLYLPR
jgi:lipoprotein NlpD